MGKYKYLKPITAIVAVCLLWAFSSLSQAAEHAHQNTSGLKSNLWLTGDSSLHPYSSTANGLLFAATFSPNSSGTSTFDKLTSGQMQTLEVKVPVKDMKSGKNQLDKNMQKALKAENNPAIVFHLKKYDIAASTTAAQTFHIKADGSLEIAGVKKDIQLEARITKSGDDMRIEGEKLILMTDYGIKPPKILLIKTANEVIVHFDLYVALNGELK
jgi:polyisoprenoid-binding protein YceI